VVEIIVVDELEARPSERCKFASLTVMVCSVENVNVKMLREYDHFTVKDGCVRI